MWPNDPNDFDPSYGLPSSASNKMLPQVGEKPWYDGFSLFGNATQKGQFGNIMGGLGAVGQMYLGMQQYGLQKDALKQAKEQFAKNYAAQKGMTNSALSDRQIARNAAGPGYQDTAGYMAQYGIA